MGESMGTNDLIQTWDSMEVPFHDVLSKHSVRYYLEWGGGKYSTEWAKRNSGICTMVTVEHDPEI